MHDSRLKILIILMSILIAGGIIAVVIAVKMDSGQVAGKTDSMAIMDVDSTQYDFGDIKIDGGLVSHKFEISNTGEGELKLSDISTSCMCTSAYLEFNGEKSPKFGMHKNPIFWSQKIASGEKGTLEVIFDPMAHGPDAIGPITRNVSVYSNDNGQKSVKSIFTFTANVIR
jgi:hypothetical protein